MADTNYEMVTRSHTARWLAKYATPQVLQLLAESMPEGNDQNMVRDIYHRLTGRELVVTIETE